MEGESKIDASSNNNIIDPYLDAPSTFLYEKLLEAFGSMIEKILDKFTLNKFMEFYGGDLAKEFYIKNRIEFFIHQLRDVLRKEFKGVFISLVMKFNIKENLRTITSEIEKARILKDFEDITGNLFSQGPDYYFDFLAGVVDRLKNVNEEVACLLFRCKPSPITSLILGNSKESGFGHSNNDNSTVTKYQTLSYAPSFDVFKLVSLTPFYL